jgi:hypothetical protein
VQVGNRVTGKECGSSKIRETNTRRLGAVGVDPDNTILNGNLSFYTFSDQWNPVDNSGTLFVGDIYRDNWGCEGRTSTWAEFAVELTTYSRVAEKEQCRQCV